mmetsp:Transcript_6881/g.10070  ORF Transcript_6881/g.10070 Transcript_6881/m.10070 type:complete len:736 (+) Transcript_6881:42-2249(+)
MKNPLNDAKEKLEENIERENEFVYEKREKEVLKRERLRLNKEWNYFHKIYNEKENSINEEENIGEKELNKKQIDQIFTDKQAIIPEEAWPGTRVEELQETHQMVRRKRRPMIQHSSINEFRGGGKMNNQRYTARDELGLYRELGIEPNATENTIKRAKKLRSRAIHPDLTEDQKEKEYRNQKLTKINNAYEILMNWKTRVAYDMYGEAGLSVIDSLKNQKELDAIQSKIELIAKIEEYLKQMKQTQNKEMFLSNTTIQFDLNEEDDRHILDPTKIRTYTGWYIPLSNTHRFHIQTLYETDQGDNEYNIGLIQYMYQHSPTLFVNMWTRLNDGTGEHNVSIIKDFINPYDNSAIQCELNTETIYYPSWMLYKTNFSLSRAISANFLSKMEMSYSDNPSLTCTVNNDEHELSLRLAPNKALERIHVRGSEWELSYSRKVVLARENFSEESNPSTELTTDMTLARSTFGSGIFCNEMKNRFQVRPGFHNIKVSNTIDQHVGNSTFGIGFMVGNEGSSVIFKISHGKTKLKVPIYLVRRDFSWRRLFLANIVPYFVGNVVKTFIANPITRLFKASRARAHRDKIYQACTKAREQAEQELQGMDTHVKQIIDSQDACSGLIIMNATYGAPGDHFDVKYPPMVDVTKALQALVDVQTSKLSISGDQPFSTMKGVFDPCPGEHKVLDIEYRFHGRHHEFRVDDETTFELPFLMDAIDVETDDLILDLTDSESEDESDSEDEQ